MLLLVLVRRCGTGVISHLHFYFLLFVFIVEVCAAPVYIKSGPGLAIDGSFMSSYRMTFCQKWGFFVQLCLTIGLQHFSKVL